MREKHNQLEIDPDFLLLCELKQKVIDSQFFHDYLRLQQAPSLSTCPNSCQKAWYFSASFFLIFASMSSTRLVNALFMESTVGSFAKSLWKHFKEISLESNTLSQNANTAVKIARLHP